MRSSAVKAVPRLQIGSSRSDTPVGSVAIVSATARIAKTGDTLHPRLLSRRACPAGVPDALALGEQGPDLSRRRLVGEDVEGALHRVDRVGAPAGHYQNHAPR